MSRRLLVPLVLLFSVAVVAQEQRTRRDAETNVNEATGTHGLLLVDHMGAKLRFLDPTTYGELTVLDVPVNPHEVAISPDHAKAYLPIYGDGVYGFPSEPANPHPGHEIVVVDLVTRSLAGSIDVSPCQAPHGIQVDRSGLLYVTCERLRSLLVVDPERKKVVATIQHGGTGHFFVVLADGSKAYVANKQDRFVSVIDLKKRVLLKRIDAPMGSDGIAAAPDGRHVAIGAFGVPSVMVIDTATDTIVDTGAPMGEGARQARMRYSLDGSKILISNNRGNGFVNIMAADKLSGPQFLVNTGKNPAGFASAPDGSTVLVANGGDGTVSVIDLNVLRVVKTFQGGAGIDTLSYY